MKSTSYFVTAVTIFYSWHFRISAGVNDWEIPENYTRASSRNVEWKCSTDDDCTTKDTKCIDKTCQCQPKYVFNAHMTSCLKAATAFGDACEDTTQCTVYLLAGGNCSAGVCGCIKGYHYLHGRCIRSSGLEEKCLNDDQCYVNDDYEALSCSGGVCQCSDGFYIREYRTCRREAKEIGAGCMIDKDCVFDKNAQCDKKEGCFIASNRQKTHSRISYEALRRSEVQDVRADVIVGDNCSSDKDCEVLGAAVCDPANECACRPGHFANAQLTSCVGEIGEKCELSDKPSIKNAVCLDGKWTCGGATVTSKNNRICRKVTTVYNTSCQFDEQCYVFGPDALCLNKKRCVCNDNSHYSEADIFCWTNRGVDESCESDEDCYVNGFASKLICSNSVCACPVGEVVNANGTACTCPANYFQANGKCVPGIGANCTVETDCKAENSTCVSQQCRCQSGFVAPSIDSCVLASPFGGDCQYDDQCSATTEGAICALPEADGSPEITSSRSEFTSGTCSCDTGHHYKYGRCYRRKVLQEACKSRGECYVQSSLDTVVCRKGVCSCQWQAIQRNSTYCESGAPSKIVLQSLMILIILISFITFI